MKKKVVDVRYAKSAEYRKVLREIADHGRCPFCPGNFKHHKNAILRRSGNWFITRNSWSYPKAEHHFMVIGLKHKESIFELSNSDLGNILHLMKWAAREFNIPGGAFAMRFGDTTYTGATVCHLHCHLIVPQLNCKTI